MASYFPEPYAPTIDKTSLKSMKMTELNPVLILSQLKPKDYTFRAYPGLAIKRIHNSNYWVYDTKNLKGIMCYSFEQAKALLEEIFLLDF